jgi:hypothetical protein
MARCMRSGQIALSASAQVVNADNVPTITNQAVG